MLIPMSKHRVFMHMYVRVLRVIEGAQAHEKCSLGFSAVELAKRIKHLEPKVILTASCGVEPNRVIK